MLDPILVQPGVFIPEGALAMRAVRASGPGGQNVNKVSTKVELRVELGRIVGLDDGARARLASACAGALDGQGRLLVTSQRTRDQRRNLEDAREKVRALVAAALVRPRRRRATRPTRASVERRLGEKKHRADRKQTRRGED